MTYVARLCALVLSVGLRWLARRLLSASVGLARFGLPRAVIGHTYDVGTVWVHADFGIENLERFGLKRSLDVAVERE